MRLAINRRTTLVYNTYIVWSGLIRIFLFWWKVYVHKHRFIFEAKYELKSYANQAAHLKGSRVLFYVWLKLFRLQNALLLAFLHYINIINLLESLSFSPQSWAAH